MGGIALSPPTFTHQDVAMVAMDPYNYNTNGVRWASAADGKQSNAVEVVGNGTGEFGKGAGMGDIEILCDAAPLQIGNRVWYDIDADGIQDPGEGPAVGVTVHLYDSLGSLVGTAITDADGQYYFTSTNDESASGDGDAFGGGLAPNATYTIKLNNADDYSTGGPLENWLLTDQFSTTAVTTDHDTAIDSNAALGTGTTYGVNKFPEVSVDSHAPGQVDHTFDIGFFQLLAVGNYTWFDTDLDGIQDGTESPVAGVTVTLYNADGTPAYDYLGNPATAITDASGFWFIDGLAPGDYRAHFSTPTGYGFTLPGQGTSSNDSNPDPATGLTPVFTLSSDGADMVADTDPSTIANYVNPTIDAGYVDASSVGDYVWFDTNHDGLQDATDVPLAGVTLPITTAAGGPVTDVFGNPVTTTTTDADGLYLFENLPLGQYKVTVTTPTGLS